VHGRIHLSTEQCCHPPLLEVVKKLRPPNVLIGDMSKRVSVIVTNYNYGEFLTECLDSIWQQSFRDYELILVDDGSADTSRQIYQRYSYAIDKLILFKENRGVDTAGNVGVSAAEGEYCCFINADDSIHPSYLSKCVEALDHSPKCAVAYTDFWHFGGGKHDPVHFQDYSLEALEKWNFMLASALFRKKVYQDVGGLRLREGFEDYDLWLNICRSGWDAVRVPGLLYMYRNHTRNRSLGINYEQMGNKVKEMHGLKPTIQQMASAFQSTGLPSEMMSIVAYGQWLISLLMMKRSKRLLTIGASFADVVCRFYNKFYESNSDVRSTTLGEVERETVSNLLKVLNLPADGLLPWFDTLPIGYFDFIFWDFQAFKAEHMYVVIQLSGMFNIILVNIPPSFEVESLLLPSADWKGNCVTHDCGARSYWMKKD
jgi:glycosyltransferase involved in cell wall biosynthesis